MPADLVRPGPCQFCRVFKRSYGVPSYRYHTSRRIERAKVLLATPALVLMEIGLTVGFSETGSFTAAFRKGRTSRPPATAQAWPGAGTG